MATKITINKSAGSPQPPFQGQQSFVQRLLEVAVKLANNSKTNQPATFAGTGSDTVTLSGSRTSVRIQNSGAPGGSIASIDVWGMTPSLMNQLATLGLVFNIIPKNTITIAAGDADVGLSSVFSGTITAGYGEYNAAPDVPFHFEALSGLAESVAPAVASSFPGAGDVAQIMAGFARQMNLGFQNSGVTAKISNAYFPGNLQTQMRACAEHANINAEVIEGNVLAIWPKGGSRTGGPIPLISKKTGMIGYPAYTQQGIIVRTTFNPQIAFGGLVRVQSSLRSVNDVGTWAVQKLDLALDSLVPRGQWMATIHAYNPNYPKPIPPQA